MSYRDGEESVAKQWARSYIWLEIEQYVASNANVLVLAGPLAGDVNTAEVMGFSRRRITAVDQDAYAIGHARMVEPGANYVHAKLDKFVETCNKKFEVIFLDFCGFVTRDKIATFTKCVKKLAAPKAAVGFCFSYGREPAWNEIELERGTKWEKRFSYAKRLIEASMPTPKLRYIYGVRYLSRCGNDKGFTPMFGVIALAGNQKPKAPFYWEDFHLGEDLG
jgi:hypothetical protein